MSDSGDYKYGAQLIAEELAEKRFGCDFYELDSDQRQKLYNEGLEAYFERGTYD